MTKRILKVFVGYQLKSEFHGSTALKNVMLKKIAPLIKKQIGITLDFKFGDKFYPGEFLFSQVEDAINKCEVAIFDISENNRNVMIEVGMALGAKKFTILLKNVSSSADYPVPSDIKAFIYVPYKKIESITSNIIKPIANYCKNHTPDHWFFKKLWGFNYNDVVCIVCPELEEPDKRQNPEPNEFLYHGKYGDIDSLITLFSALSKLYPNLNLHIHTGKEFKSLRPVRDCEHLILLGGPDYNPVTKYFLKKKNSIPYKFIELEDEMTVMKRKGGKTFISKLKIEEDQGHDYGFFVKFNNPNNNKKKVIMISGIHTYGVYGAAKCFVLHRDGENEVAVENCKKVINKIGGNNNFATHFQVQIMKNEVGVPTINTRDIIKIR